ncbi:MAG: lysozyme [Lachnospiraceae bacterium]
MHTSDNGVEFIISLEGISLKAYKLSGETYYTIGVGHYGPDVKAGQTITRQKAVSLLKKDLKRFETAVQNTVTDIKLTQNRFDALVSYTFNRGEGGLRQLASNSHTPAEYATNMVKYWGSATRYKSALIARRKKEAALFKKADQTSTEKTATTDDAKTKCIKKGQKYANTFADCELKITGTRTAITKMAAVRVVQHALNLDYHAGLVEDGDWNDMTERAFGSHYVKKGEKQYMVTALEILLLLKGYDPKGVEIPGEFGDGAEKALMKFNGKKVAKISTFKALCK